MKKALLFAALVLTLASSASQCASAQTVTAPAPASTSAGMLPQVGMTPTPITVNQTPAPEKATSESIGTWIADLIGGLVAIFGTVIAKFATQWVMALAKKAGIEAAQAASDKLDDIIERGLHAGAAKVPQGRTKNQI
jgi:hypothetical protein